MRADEAGESDGQTPTGDHADLGVSVGETSLVRCDQEVAREGDFEATGDGRSVDGADDR